MPGKKTTPSQETKQLTLRMSADLHRRLKVKSASEGLTMGEVLISLITKYVSTTKKRGG